MIVSLMAADSLLIKEAWLLEGEHLSVKLNGSLTERSPLPAALHGIVERMHSTLQ